VGNRVSFYHVYTDVDRFQYLLSDDDCDYWFDGRPYRHVWTPPTVFSYKPTREEPDFWEFGMGKFGTAWAIRPEAFKSAPELQPTIADSGELLPLPVDGRNFTVFNITECIDALDTERTAWRRYEDGSVADVEKPVFRIDRLGANLFKVPEDTSLRIYFWEDGSWQDQFRALVEKAALTGLEFKFLYAEDV
jgi:hypothetical protein